MSSGAKTRHRRVARAVVKGASSLPARSTRLYARAHASLQAHCYDSPPHLVIDAHLSGATWWYRLLCDVSVRFAACIDNNEDARVLLSLPSSSRTTVTAWTALMFRQMTRAELVTMRSSRRYRRDSDIVAHVGGGDDDQPPRRVSSSSTTLDALTMQADSLRRVPERVDCSEATERACRIASDALIDATLDASRDIGGGKSVV